MDDFEQQKVFLAFVYRGQRVQQCFSALDWAAMFLRKRPYSGRMRKTRKEYERQAIDQGLVAINSQMRDLIKAQMSAIESGMRSFESIFLADMLTGDGRPVLERVAGMLPKPDEKIVSLPSKSA
jgi:hypothetical protein